MAAPGTAVIEERPIAAASPLYNARLVRREDLTPSLAVFWVAFDGQPVDFLPGQYLTIGVESNGKLLQRPYSVASSPRVAADGYEFYVRLVDGGLFTPLLWRLPLGHAMSMKGPKGKFMLEPDDGRMSVFISSGTGIAPFVAMLDTVRRDGQRRPAIVLHGASYADELGYSDLFGRWQAGSEVPVRYIATVSRPRDQRNKDWDGRVGRVEAIVPAVFDELDLTPANAVAYLCGNPDMIQAVDELLQARGFPEAQVKKELYWPKGKAPSGAGMATVPPGD